jgi:imidazolonepropionase-like amidohydrolase
VDDEFIALMKSAGAPYIPTLTRELSTFVYESRPAFFDDPLFVRHADPAVVSQWQQPARQQAMRASRSAQAFKAALAVANRNLKRLADAGVLIAMGTDSGASAERFQGFFEHLELEMMGAAGLTPAQVLRAATADAARAMRMPNIGTIAPGAWADFVVLDRDPLTDIRNSRSIRAVWIAGNDTGSHASRVEK